MASQDHPRYPLRVDLTRITNTLILPAYATVKYHGSRAIYELEICPRLLDDTIDNYSTSFLLPTQYDFASRSDPISCHADVQTKQQQEKIMKTLRTVSHFSHCQVFHWYSLC